MLKTYNLKLNYLASFYKEGKEKMKETVDTLKKFLEKEAGDLLYDNFIAPIVKYVEDVNPDAADGDAWLKNKTSYIWKIGVLSIADGNKRDWAYLFIGHQREPDARFELIGNLYWSDGENDDPARCLRRYLKCAADADILFLED